MRIITFAGALVAPVLALAPPASAHVGVYVAGMSGVAIDTTTANATYTVAFAPGHGCTGPRTTANPDGVYETTSLEVFMPRAASGAFILPEVKVVHGLGYDATLRTVPDPTNAALKRVNSIVFDNFRLQAINGGYTARDAQMFTITVKLPKIADVKAANYGYASGDATKSGAKIYFPTMQYCDVTNQNVGILSSSSTPAAIGATVDPTCTSADTMTNTLHDDWTTVGNTPSLIIGTSTSSIFEISGNAPSVAAAPAETFCSKPGGFNPRDLRLNGKFEVSVSGKAHVRTLAVSVVDSGVRSGRTYKVVTAKGTVLASAKVGADGVINTRVRSALVNKLKAGTQLRLMWGKKVLAVDNA